MFATFIVISDTTVAVFGRMITEFVALHLNKTMERLKGVKESHPKLSESGRRSYKGRTLDLLLQNRKCK